LISLKIDARRGCAIGARAEAALARETDPKEQIKVTDKRLFTPDGELRDEYREEVHPVEPQFTPAPPPEPEAERTEPPQDTRAAQQPPAAETQRERRKRLADRAANPGTPFTNFVEPLIAQAYMSLGMLRNPYAPQAPEIDPKAARQMIDILNLLEEKTKGNLTEDEDDFLATHVGELKLAYVQRTKSI
jgi:hypothetical protein